MPTWPTSLPSDESAGGVLWQPTWLSQGKSLAELKYPPIYLQLLKWITPLTDRHPLGQCLWVSRHKSLWGAGLLRGDPFD